MQTAGPSVAYELWNINTITENGWYITIKVPKIDQDKIVVASFDTKSGWKLTISVNLEINVRTWGTWSWLWFFYLKLFGVC
jgi:hypothetical protein